MNERLCAVVLFVSRHEPTRHWAKAHAPDLAARAEFVEHLPPERIAALGPDDVVAGTLPVNLIADINARGARYLHLAMDLPPEARERTDLTKEEMERYNARLVPFTAVAVRGSEQDSGAAPPAQPRTGGRSRASRAKGLIYFVAIAPSGGIGTNVLSRLWGGERPPFDFWWRVDLAVGLGCIVVLIFAALALYRLRHALLAHHVVTEEDKVSKPCRVLITALSPDGIDPTSRSLRGDLLLDAVQGDARLGLDLFRLTKAQIESRLREMGVDFARWEKVPWLTNFVAVAAHDARLDTVVVLPSADQDGSPGTVHRAERFSQILQLIWSRGRRGSRSLRILTALGRNYDDYRDLLAGIDEAARLGGARSEREVCIDVTSGTKPISIAGAITTINKDYTFMYVTNARRFVILDSRIELGEAW
jgi:CRISPR-associated protein Csx16